MKDTERQIGPLGAEGTTFGFRVQRYQTGGILGRTFFLHLEKKQ